MLAEPFTVHEPDIASIGEPSLSWNLVYVITGFVIIGLSVTALILILKRIRSSRTPKTPSDSPTFVRASEAIGKTGDN